MLGGGLTGVILVLAWTPLYDLVVLRAMGIPPPIADAARPTLKILAFMPLISSSRVFYQGLLVRRHRPRALGLGSGGQYMTLAIVLAAGVGSGLLRSSIVAACATICGEIANTTIMFWRARSTEPRHSSTARVSVGEVSRFYWPLALSMVMMTFFEPILNAGMARTWDAVFALAAYPIYTSIIALIDWPVWNVQQVTLTLVTDESSYRLIRRFALKLSLVFAVVLFLFWAVTSYTLASAVAAAREAVELLAEWTEAARDREGR